MEENKLYYVINTPGIKSSFDTIRVKIIEKKGSLHWNGIYRFDIDETSYYKQLLQPLGMVAMSLIACAFVNLNLRNRANNYMFMISLMVGLVIFFIQEILVQFLVYNGFAPLISSLIPVITTILLAIFVV